jgi:hypothetical protein
MTQGTGQEPTHPTRSLPKKHVIGVIDQVQEAEQVVQALQDAGYAAQDILLIPSQAFIEGIQERRQHTSRLRQALHIFLTSSDEDFPDACIRSRRGLRLRCWGCMRPRRSRPNRSLKYLVGIMRIC